MKVHIIKQNTLIKKYHGVIGLRSKAYPGCKIITQHPTLNMRLAGSWVTTIYIMKALC